MRPRPDGKTCGPRKRVSDLLLWAALRLLVGRGRRRGPELLHVRYWRLASEGGNARALDSGSPVLIPGPVETPGGEQKLLDHLRLPPESCLGSLVDEGQGRVYHLVYGDGRAAVAARARPRAPDGGDMARRGRSNIRHLSGAAAMVARRA